MFHSGGIRDEGYDSCGCEGLFEIQMRKLLFFPHGAENKDGVKEISILNKELPTCVPMTTHN